MRAGVSSNRRNKCVSNDDIKIFIRPAAAQRYGDKQGLRPELSYSDLWERRAGPGSPGMPYDAAPGINLTN